MSHVPPLPQDRGCLVWTLKWAARQPCRMKLDFGVIVVTVHFQPGPFHYYVDAESHRMMSFASAEETVDYLWWLLGHDKRERYEFPHA